MHTCIRVQRVCTCICVNIFQRVIIVHDWRDERGVTGGAGQWWRRGGKYNNNKRSEIVCSTMSSKDRYFSKIIFLFTLFYFSEKNNVSVRFPIVRVCVLY